MVLLFLTVQAILLSKQVVLHYSMPLSCGHSNKEELMGSKARQPVVGVTPENCTIAD